MNKNCFVIQPFSLLFDSRYNDTFEVAIVAASLTPYRVDKDNTSVIPIESIEKGIREADIIFAEITTDNPNVWYELGYAFACDKEVVMVCCSDERTGPFPFDIRHRTIINYKSSSKSDYIKLEKDIKDKLIALAISRKQKEKIESKQYIPGAIEKYLKSFPNFKSQPDINRGYVKTSRESFFTGLKCILEDLEIGTKVISTDSINLQKTAQYLKYWAEEGLQYLKLNYFANQRGVSFIRIFIVDKDEYLKNQGYILLLAKLHKAAGVESRYIFYQELLGNPTYLREFAVFGDRYTDETIFDVRSNRVIDNYIHWSSDINAAFSEIANIVHSLSHSFDGLSKTKKAKTVYELERIAERCSKEEIHINI